MYNVHTLVYLQAGPPSTHKSIKLVNVPTNDGIKYAQMAEMAYTKHPDTNHISSQTISLGSYGPWAPRTLL